MRGSELRSNQTWRSQDIINYVQLNIISICTYYQRVVPTGCRKRRSDEPFWHQQDSRAAGPHMPLPCSKLGSYFSVLLWSITVKMPSLLESCGCLEEPVIPGPLADTWHSVHQWGGNLWVFVCKINWFCGWLLNRKTVQLLTRKASLFKLIHGNRGGIQGPQILEDTPTFLSPCFIPPVFHVPRAPLPPSIQWYLSCKILAHNLKCYLVFRVLMH